MSSDFSKKAPKIQSKIFNYFRQVLKILTMNIVKYHSLFYRSDHFEEK